MTNNVYKWLGCLDELVAKKLILISRQELKTKFPVIVDELQRNTSSTHLEFVGRTLCGIAPLIEIDGLNKIGITNDDLYAGIHSITDPKSPDYLNFNQGTQPLVDTAFFALAFLRSPKVLWGSLPANTKQQVIDAFKSSRSIRPHFNNWLLFSAMIEAFFFMVGEDYDKMRIDYALRQHEQWYLGDGHYGDGPQFHIDYYNSYVILPFLLQITQTLKGQFKDWDNLGVKVIQRAGRYAEVQERMISHDGTFPPIGRSITYRGGAFHLLAQLALMKLLPASLKPAQVRCALWAVIEKTLIDRNNYDEEGWLRIGLNGFQPSLGENYISTGSLYLTTVIFLPLGLTEDDEFWTSPDEAWTQKKIWCYGNDIPADKAL